MGSSSGEASNKGIDASVGGLVWVRRRNGSWWPGRIMGLNEISASCLVSPRSGTPVKLLGREDASVDWYNLEKSKRVKAFRCGEYDDCIAKAKASAANSSKKAVKYARREDAIIHALEIENARLAKDPVNSNGGMDTLGRANGSSARESPSMSQSGNQNDNADDDGRRRTPNDSEDDGTEGVKRMRGLEDLGVGIASKRRVSSGALLELCQQENALLSNSNNGNSLPNGNVVNGCKGSSLLKRKRTPVANVHEFLKKKNRRRPLTKVLESTAMVSIPVACNQIPSSCGSPIQGVSDGKVSVLESTESKRDTSVTSCEDRAALNVSEPACDTSHYTVTKENEISSPSGVAETDSSDRLFDVPFIGEGKQSADPSPAVVPSSSEKVQVGALKRQSSQSSQADGVSLKNDGVNETGSTSSETMHANIGQRLEKGTSKWQLKGKRNSRKMNRNRKQDSRKYVNMDDIPNTCLAGIIKKDELSHGFDQKLDCNGINGPSGSHDCALETKCKPDADDREDESKNPSVSVPNINGPTAVEKCLPDDSLPSQRLLPYRQSRFTVNSRYRMSDISVKNIPSESSLYEVKVEVKANYKPPHVPLVSLMSKLNGKAIVGHPLTVEVLEDGFCDRMLSAVEGNVEEGTSTGYVKRSSVKARILKHMVLQPRLTQQRKSPKKKKSGLLPKKIRRLSSLTSGKKSEERRTVAEKPKGPVIACIPIKLVFSRINEAVNGSARQTHRV